MCGSLYPGNASPGIRLCGIGMGMHQLREACPGGVRGYMPLLRRGKARTHLAGSYLRHSQNVFGLRRNGRYPAGPRLAGSHLYAAEDLHPVRLDGRRCAGASVGRRRGDPGSDLPGARQKPVYLRPVRKDPGRNDPGGSGESHRWDRDPGCGGGDRDRGRLYRRHLLQGMRPVDQQGYQDRGAGLAEGRRTGGSGSPVHSR